MRILSKRTLRMFWEKHLRAAAPLALWYDKVAAADWKTPADIRNDFGSADFIADNRVIFDIGGNKFRIVAHLFYRRRQVLIKFVGTHAPARSNRPGANLMDVRPIRTEADYDWALSQIEAYFENQPDAGTPEDDRLEVLSTLVEAYERAHWPIPACDPIDILKHAIDDLGHTQTELADVLGSRSHASEILARKRPLSLEMIRRISEAWEIPATLLLPSYRLEDAA